MTANGGTIIVLMVLTEGNPDEAPFGLSFNITLTVSPITPLPGFSDVYNWLPITLADVPGFYGIGFPDSIYDDLPAVNQNLVPYFINGWGLWEDDYLLSTIWFNSGLEEGMFEMNGTFSIHVSSLPSTPDGFTITEAHVRWGRSYAFTSDEDHTVVYSAMYSRIIEFTNFGETADFEFLAFNSGMGTTALPNPTRPIWWGDAFVVYEVIPEPSTTSLALLLGTAAMAVRRRAAKRAAK